MRNIIKPEHRCTRVLGRLAHLPRDERQRLARIAGLASVASERGHRWTSETPRDGHGRPLRGSEETPKP